MPRLCWLITHVISFNALSQRRQALLLPPVYGQRSSMTCPPLHKHHCQGGPPSQAVSLQSLNSFPLSMAGGSGGLCSWWPALVVAGAGKGWWDMNLGARLAPGARSESFNVIERVSALDWGQCKSIQSILEIISLATEGKTERNGAWVWVI